MPVLHGCRIYAHKFPAGRKRRKAEYSTYDDGSIETLNFYTTGFSSFFTSKKQLDVARSEKILAEAVTDFVSGTDNSNTENDNRSIYIIVGIIAAAVVIVVSVVALAGKRKHKC